MDARKFDIVITMAGRGSRFRSVGYTVPKYMIEVKGKTLFDWSMESLSAFREVADRYIFIALRDAAADVRAFIAARCAALGIMRYEIVVIEDVTAGQAATAMLAAPYWTADHALLLYNIDTYVEAGAMRPADLRGDGALPCFVADGDHWSFAKADADGRVSEVREKVRISDYCSIGAYYFRTCEVFRETYEAHYGAGGCAGEKEEYVAPLYNTLIARGGAVYMSLVEASRVHVLGTPEEVAVFRDA